MEGLRLEDVIAGVGQDSIRFIMDSAYAFDISAFTELYSPGMTPENLYCVKNGLVALTLRTPLGKERLLRIFGPGKFFGHRSFLAEETYHATARTLENSRLIRIPLKTLKAAMNRDPAIAMAFTKTLARDLRHQELRLLALSDHPASSRVAATLLYLNSLQLRHHFTRAEIAEYAGTTEATVIRVIRKMAQEGIVRTRGWKVLLNDREALKKIAEEEPHA